MRPEILKSNKHLFTISNGAGGLRVHAPLPEQFGFGVGANLSAPFGVYALAGELNKLFILYGKDMNAGLTTTKFWSGMEQPDISTTLQFRAYESARDDVVSPVLTLAIMSTGVYADGLGNTKVGSGQNKVRLADLIADILNVGGDLLNKGAELVGAGGNILPTVTTGTIRDFFSFVSAPAMCSVRFGDVFLLSNVYISAFDVQFTNQIDYEGYPMSADVSLTLTLKRPMGRSELTGAFGWPRQHGAVTPQKLRDPPGS